MHLRGHHLRPGHFRVETGEAQRGVATVQRPHSWLVANPSPEPGLLTHNHKGKIFLMHSTRLVMRPESHSSGQETGTTSTVLINQLSLKKKLLVCSVGHVNVLWTCQQQGVDRLSEFLKVPPVSSGELGQASSSQRTTPSTCCDLAPIHEDGTFWRPEAGGQEQTEIGWPQVKGEKRENPGEKVLIKGGWLRQSEARYPSKISKPAASSVPVQNSLCILASKVLLILTTSHLNILSYTVLPRAPMGFWPCSMFWPSCTNLLLTLTCSLVMPFWSSLKLRPMRWATLSATEQGKKKQGSERWCPALENHSPCLLCLEKGLWGEMGRPPMLPLRKLGSEAVCARDIQRNAMQP